MFTKGKKYEQNLLVILTVLCFPWNFTSKTMNLEIGEKKTTTLFSEVSFNKRLKPTVFLSFCENLINRTWRRWTFADWVILGSANVFKSGSVGRATRCTCGRAWSPRRWRGNPLALLHIHHPVWTFYPKVKKPTAWMWHMVINFH